jgi:prepilin-type N-terminal cleavage/methylation domain-containing protein
MNTTKIQSTKGFTLLEILGVLAIIGVLAAIALVGVNKGRKTGNITNAIGTVSHVQSALQGFLQKPGGLGYIPLTNAATAASFNLSGTNLQAASAATISKACTLDTVLVTERYLESPIDLGIGTGNNAPAGAQTHPLLWSPTGNYFYCNPDAAPDFDYTLVPHLMCQLSTTNLPGTDGTNFYLDASLTPLAANARVVCLMIPAVQGSDAALLSNQYDNKSTSTATAAVSTGRVTYAAPNATTGLTTVYMYVGSY